METRPNLNVRQTFCEGSINPLSANPTKWSNTLKQFVGKLSTNFLSVFDHFDGLAIKGLKLCVHQAGVEARSSFETAVLKKITKFTRKHFYSCRP